MPRITKMQANDIRVNIRTQVNASKIRNEKRDGRDYIIVPSATLPDNIIMNGGLYPADEIEASYKTLERTPAPLGHPYVNGEYISAYEPEAVNQFWVGAFNENVRRESGRVYLDKAIDVEVASRTEQGRALIDAINSGEPIHTSTGLTLTPEYVENQDYDWIGRNMKFDHDAILMGEVGAATPEQGVGMMVNGKNVSVINSEITDWADRDLDFAAHALFEAIERKDKVERHEGLKDRLIGMVKSLFSDSQDASTQTKDDEEDTMSVTQEDFDALKDQVTTLASNQLSKEDIISAINESVKPISEKVEQIQTNSEAKEAEEKAELVAKITKDGKFTEEEVKAMPMSVLKKMVGNSAPSPAYNMAGGFLTNESDADLVSNELPEIN